MSYSDDDEFHPPRAVRQDGWSVERQLAFLEALAADGHVARAAAGVDRSPSSAYRLRARSESFARAWVSAGAMAYHRLRDLALDRIGVGEVTQQLYHGEVVGTRTRYSDRLLIAMLDHLKPVAYDPRGPGGARPPDPAVAYAAAIAAYTTALDTGAEPQVPLMADDGRSRPVMTRAEFIEAIRMRPRPPAPGDEDYDPMPGPVYGPGCFPDAAPAEENDFSSRA